MTIDEYLNKLKSLCHEIYGLDSIAAISKSRIKRIIVNSLRLELKSFVIAIIGYSTQPTIENFENLLADQKVIKKQLSEVLVMDDEEAFFIDKKRHRFRQHSDGVM